MEVSLFRAEVKIENKRKKANDATIAQMFFFYLSSSLVNPI